MQRGNQVVLVEVLAFFMVSMLPVPEIPLQHHHHKETMGAQFLLQEAQDSLEVVVEVVLVLLVEQDWLDLQYQLLLVLLEA